MGYVFPGGSILAWRQGGDVVVFWEIRIVRGGVMSGCLVVRNGEVARIRTNGRDVAPRRAKQFHI